jgi:hypothetical protein
MEWLFAIRHLLVGFVTEQLRRFSLKGFDPSDARHHDGTLRRGGACVEFARIGFVFRAQLVITSEMDEWLKQTVLTSTPDKFGYDTNLWACAIVVGLLKEKFSVSIPGAVTEVEQAVTNQADLTEIRRTLKQVVRVKG